MSQSNAPKTPGVPATMNTVWPPSNPSGTVIPFPLPWGQTGCCPPGGMDALMKCYCDIQQASAFIGQVMLDQINNNPAITEAIIAAIEKSGSNLPLIGVTNGSDAQPGQVGEYIQYGVSIPFTGAANESYTPTFGVLPPGDWDTWVWNEAVSIQITGMLWRFFPFPTPGVENDMFGQAGVTTGTDAPTIYVPGRITISVPTLIAFTLQVNTYGVGPGAGNFPMIFAARRRR